LTAPVQLLHVSKAFPGVQALRDVSLTLRPGSIHALLGENGAGKSTLINILGGILTPDQGGIHLGGGPVRFSDARAARRHGIAVVPQEVDLFPDLSVAENIGLEQGLPRSRLGFVDWPALRRRARRALELVAEPLSPDIPASSLSPARRQMVLIAAAVSEAAHVLVLDEPTSSLSAAEAEVLFEHLRRFRAGGAAILYVSHRLEEVFRLAEEATVLRDGRLVWTGPLREVSRERLVELMVGREEGERIPARNSSDGPSIVGAPGGLSGFSCRALTAADGAFTDITLEVQGGEVLGLYGLIGAGRSEWAQAVFGLRPLLGGEILINGRPVWPSGPGMMMRAGLAYVPEDRLRQGLCRGLSVTANAVLAVLRRLARGPWVSRRLEERFSQGLVARLGVRLRSLGQPVGTLSGGNQQKVVLGRWLGCEPRVLLLDEPTRGVDVGAKEEIHSLIRSLTREGRAIVLISSDLQEVLGQSDRVGVFRGGRLAGFFNPAATSAAEVAAAALPESQGRKSEIRNPKSEVRNSKSEIRSKSQPGRLRELGLLVVLLALFALVQWRTGRLWPTATLQGVGTDAALLAFPALGTALVILAGGIDISLGALMALCAGVAATLWQDGWPAPAALAAALAVGAAGGLVNAGLSLLGRVHPIVVTLGTMSLYRGLAQRVIGGIIPVPGEKRFWFQEAILGVPLPVLLGAGLTLVVWLLLSRTISGRELYAVGGNPAAAVRVGIHPGRVWLKAFALQGILVGAAGFLNVARVGSVEDTSFDPVTLEAIAAVVVGGVAILGGRGSAVGVLLGCLFLAALTQTGILLKVGTTWQHTLIGGVLVLAVTLDTLWRRGGR
jgi:ABC-type sugar transport system ATPase subunit/ribose/xylose/arabinose/galactoside ABC-type transport system permease subunit